MFQDLSLMLDLIAAAVTIAYLGSLVFEAFFHDESGTTKRSLVNQQIYFSPNRN